MKPEPRLKIFILLKYGLDAEKYYQLFLQGKVPGASPYDYHRVESFNCQGSFSKDYPENIFQNLFRRIIFKIAGGDLIHAWKNRQKLWAADAVWTFSEREWLAVSFLLKLKMFRMFKPVLKRPLILGRTIWFLDSWVNWSSLRRWLYRSCLPLPDVIMVSGPMEKKIMHGIFPMIRLHCLKFGIPLESFPLKQYRLKSKKSVTIRVLSLGNDRHRDWNTLVQALGGQPGIELTIATRHEITNLTSQFNNIVFTTFFTMNEHLALYDRADLVVVTLSPCQRVSGITVILEAMARGVPVICTMTGGLEYYFQGDEICFIPPTTPEILKKSVFDLGRNMNRMENMANNAHKTIIQDGLDSRSWIKRHCQLTRQLM